MITVPTVSVRHRLRFGYSVLCSAKPVSLETAYCVPRNAPKPGVELRWAKVGGRWRGKLLLPIQLVPEIGNRFHEGAILLLGRKIFFIVLS